VIIDRITGDASRLPFDVLLSLRSQFIMRPAPTILAVLAVAASVALAASVEIASRSVSSALERSMNAMAGATQLEVTAAAQGVPEQFIDEIREIPGVRSASPIIQEVFRIVHAAGNEEPLRVIGIDLLYDREVRDYSVSESGFKVRDHVRLVASGDSIVLSEVLARRLGVEEGKQLTLRSSDGIHSVTVRGILLGDLSAAYGGSLAVMDVFALQKMIGINSRVSRIDIATESNQDLEQLRSTIQEHIGEAATVRRSTLRENVVTPILAAYSFGVWAITLIGVLLALFLTYAAISIVVDRRIIEFALLRAAGMDARRASRSVVVDAIILATVGTVFGLSLALAFAGKLVVFFSRASEFYQDLAVEPVPVSAGTFAVALTVGVPIALLACMEPARRAARRTPLEVLYARECARDSGRKVPRLLIVGMVSLSAFAAALGFSRLLPAMRLGGVVAFGVVAVWAISSALLPMAIPRIQTGLARTVPRVGVLVGASVGDRPVETGVTVAIWAAVVAATFSLLTALGSVGISMDEFIEGESGPNAIMAFTEDPTSSGPSERLPIDPGIVDAIERTPGVTGAWASQSTTVMFRGEEVPIDDYDVERLTRHGGLRFISDDTEASVDALRRGELLASDSFLSRFGLEIGDPLELETIAGPRVFRIGGSARSFSGPKGKLYLDSSEFSRWFRSPGAFAIIFWIDAPVVSTLELVRRSVSGRPLFFREGEAVQRQARRVIGRFSALLMVPLMVVGSIGLIGLANLLMGNVAARRRDLALIRASGGTTRNIVAVVGLSAAGVALFGTLAGLALGLSWAIVIRDAITHFLEFRISFVVDWRVVWLLIAGAVVAAAGAAVGPALLGARHAVRSP